MARAEKNRNLDALLQDSGFTPSMRDVPALLARLEEANDPALVERALVRTGPPVAAAIAGWIAAAGPRARATAARILARVASESAARETLIALLRDEDARVRRQAALALGRARVADAAQALADAWSRATLPEDKRALAEALGKIGGPLAKALLSEISTDDPQLERIAQRARIIVGRDEARLEGTRIDPDAAPDAPLPIVLRCRAGLEPLVVEELGPAWSARAAGEGRVEAVLSGAIASVFESRVATSFALLLPKVDRTRDLAADVVRALTSERARRVLATFTRGPIRFRLSFESGGHRRALVWACARGVAERAPELVNDPRESAWEARVREERSKLVVELEPRALDDPRFSYRVGDVPAASHPTVAAAIARVAGARDDDVVWDPFVGSGLELVERARLGPFARMLGTDLDASAIEVARKNLHAAHVSGVRLVEGDALEERPRELSLIVTNPPMGRRVKTSAGLSSLLDRFLTHAARLLVPGGRLVWLSPQPERTRARAREAGLSIGRVLPVDMGGFSAELQLLSKPARS